MHSAQELVSQIEALTSLPDVYMRVREQLESPAGSVFNVARLVSADPALSNACRCSARKGLAQQDARTCPNPSPPRC